MSTTSHTSLQMLLDSRSILPRSEPGIEPEVVANTVSEDVQELLHPDDVAAIQAAWAKVCEEDEYLKAYQWSSAPSQDVQNNQTSFPTLNQFTAPVAGLPKFPPTVPPSVNGPNFAQNYYPTIYDLELWAAGDPRAYDPKPPSQGLHAQTGVSTPSATEHTGYTYATVDNTFLPSASGSDTTLGTSNGSNLEPSSSAPDSTASARPPKRKTRHTVKSEDDDSDSSPIVHKRRCLDDDADEIKEGKFGPYTLADANAVVMAMPAHDPKPVDISSRRTHDADGNLLRTRRFGAMELDDSYGKRTVKIANGLPAGMTCVRPCDWDKDPCGLFVEMNKDRVSTHLLFWHGVKSGSKTPCKFQDCPKPKAMSSLGRHIEGVHYTTYLECPYCGKLSSRTDSLKRHQTICETFIASKALAKKERREFKLQVPKKMVYGYIVPARNAT